MHTDLSVSMSDLSHLAMVEDETLGDIRAIKSSNFLILSTQGKIRFYLLWMEKSIINISYLTLVNKASLNSCKTEMVRFMGQKRKVILKELNILP